MGALAPATAPAQTPAEDTPWLPQDDILLKNAVEAGASLESLSKGAAEFSRRFSVQELQERWNGLLYDLCVSSEASIRMVEVEHSKENKCFSEKRKFDSVRQQYYALRKRICNEPLDSKGLGYITEVGGDNAVGNGEHPLTSGYIPTNSLQNNVGLRDSNFDIVAPALTKIGAGAASGIDATDLGFCAGEDFSIDQNNIEQIVPHSFEEKTVLVKNCSMIEDLGQFKEVCSNLLKADGGEKFPSIADQTQTGEVSGYSGFRGGQVFNLTIADCDASIQSHGYSTAPSDLQVWNAIEGISSPILLDIGTGDGFVNVTSELGYGVGLSEVMMENQLSCDDMLNSGSSTDDYLTEISNALFDFTNEEEILLMGSDGNTIDKSYIDGLSSLLLDSPSHNGVLNIAAAEAFVPSDAFPNISDSACQAEVTGHPDGQERPSALNPEYRNGVICCTLNTEDPDIPCNDDVFLLMSPSLSQFALPFEMQWKIYEPPPHPTSSFSRDSPLGKKVNTGDPNQKMSERNSFEQSLVTEIGVNLPPPESGFNLELPRTDDLIVAWKASNPFEGPTQSSSINHGGCNFTPQPLSELVIKAEQTNCLSYHPDGFYLDKQAGISNPLLSFQQNSGFGSNREAQNPVTVLNEETLQAEVDTIEPTLPDLAVTHSLTNQDEFPTWNEDDVPCYSDVEAMILDMDLSPDDQDFYPRKTVLKYEHEDTKRVIIRLEQTAAACMQRNMSSRGAFAVLYGRDSDYYIKKAEVLLGRSTEDIIVDIDLGREGQNNKVSRRQAIISMDEDGSFVLRNIGRHSIIVNDREVAPKQSLSLSPGCLIEIRGIPFIFETNETCIKQYLDEIKNKS